MSTTLYGFKLPGRKRFGLPEWKVPCSKIKNNILKIKTFFSVKLSSRIFSIHLDGNNRFWVTVKQ